VLPDKDEATAAAAWSTQDAPVRAKPVVAASVIVMALVKLGTGTAVDEIGFVVAVFKLVVGAPFVPEKLNDPVAPRLCFFTTIF
jgi:hypothetical protein